jgi:large subunit ribosomal protein L19
MTDEIKTTSLEDDAKETDSATQEPDSQQEVQPMEEDFSKIKGQEINKDDIRPGMVVRVYEKVSDVTASGEERKRTQIFEGIVTALGGREVGRTMTVRKVSGGYGVEKIFPFAAPTVEKIEVVKTYKTRRAKLGFLKGVIKRGVVKSRFKRKLKEKV